MLYNLPHKNMAGLVERLLDKIGVIPPDQRKPRPAAAPPVEPPEEIAEEDPLVAYRRRAADQLKPAVAASIEAGKTPQWIVEKLLSLEVFGGLGRPELERLIKEAGGISPETMGQIVEALTNRIKSLPPRDARRTLQKWAERLDEGEAKPPSSAWKVKRVVPPKDKEEPKPPSPENGHPQRRIIVVKPVSLVEIEIENPDQLRELVDESGSEMDTEEILRLIERWATEDALELQLHAKARVQWGPLTDYYVVKRGKKGTTLFKIEGNTLRVVFGPHKKVYGVPPRSMKKDSARSL